MKKKHIIHAIQIAAITALIMFQAFVWPEIEQFTNRTFNIWPRMLIGTAFWPLLGFAFALPKMLAKGKFKFNSFFLVVVLAAVIGFAWPFLGGGFHFTGVSNILLFVIGFFIIDCFRAQE